MTYLVDLKDLKGLNDFREPFSKKMNDCSGCPSDKDVRIGNFAQSKLEVN